MKKNIRMIKRKWSIFEYQENKPDTIQTEKHKKWKLYKFFYTW
jgi:hypothetical protein